MAIGTNPAIKSFVLRGGRISKSQRRSYEVLFPVFGVPYESGKPPLDFQKIFGNSNPVCIEIGFGMGLASAQIAQSNPEINYLGLEVHRPGIGRLLWEIEKKGLSNIRIIEHDAVEVLETMIANESVSAFHVFFPDPWPKKRHHKRRLIKRPFTDLLAEKLRPGGYIYMVTDWVNYGEEALEQLSAVPLLHNVYDGFASPQSWRPQTKFERKGLEKNHQVRELIFKRVETING